MNDVSTTCCVVGGGPAGMMSGYLLARAGVPVIVLEKHADFLRDFRGDTIHPSTLDLVIGSDGRRAMTRRAAGFEVEDVGAPMDLLWFRLPRFDSDPEDPAGSFGQGHIVIMINRGDTWQCGYVIAKGSFDRVREQGLDAFRRELESLAPFLEGRSAEVKSFDEIELLTVGVDRLKRWRRPGLLCIGDAAHTMSPVGGVGINLAIQDAIAAANFLAIPLRERRLSERDLARVEERRAPAARRTQWLQVEIQNTVIETALGASAPLQPPFLLRLISWFPWLARIPGRVIGLGFRPERIDRTIFAGQ